MPRLKIATTVDGYDDFQLQPNDFVQVFSREDSTDTFGHRVTRVEMRRVIKAYDKYLQKNPKPTPEIEGALFTQYPEITKANTGYGDSRKLSASFYSVRYYADRGIALGCMEFDKKTLTKIRNWATAIAAATKTKKSTAKAPRLRAA